LEKAGKFSISAEQKKSVEQQAQKINPYYERKKNREVVQEEIKSPVFDGKVFGTLFDTYILAQLGENLYIIDQHAANERLLFDILTKQIDSGKVVMQPLLEPAVLMLGPTEMNRVMEIAPTLNRMGIECGVFGKNTFRITAVPLAVSVRGIDTVIANVLADLKGAPSGKVSEIVRGKIITECCRNAIKGGDHLSETQVGEFIAQFKGLKIPLCPHGRPVVAVLDRKAIEKMFKRQ
jgi:DNA mismatch repair protein MutL